MAAGVESQKYAPRSNGSGNWWSRTDCRHCASVANDDADAPQTSAQEKIAVLEAKQNWINSESERVESDSAKLAGGKRASECERRL